MVMVRAPSEPKLGTVRLNDVLEETLEETAAPPIVTEEGS